MRTCLLKLLVALLFFLALFFAGFFLLPIECICGC